MGVLEVRGGDGHLNGLKSVKNWTLKGTPHEYAQWCTHKNEHTLVNTHPNRDLCALTNAH